ncbi:hypothetical protein LOTGIDRAFT_231847 [Lottia gigantea]|uniref:Schwannomin interacting protein 1 C-terminal domain-containing protein n=1 Tax=Lottia gigantea TaxID=225164 RepID=V3ZX87_LOTGI|nr:hypothetical protein LOTGIDRAFT_231847 [Lottia gigantea]ESO96143.1 hypothetical protein LOTGIDRAFT_231847 [Lottia gigantea]
MKGVKFVNARWWVFKNDTKLLCYPFGLSLFSTQPNDRETIRQKLAMGSGEEEYYYNERAFKKPSFQTRLQSGMNLQICFMNEAMNEANNTLPDSLQVTSSSQPPEQQHQKPESTERHSPPVKHTDVKNGHRSKRTGDRNKSKDDNKKTSHPSRLKEEAKIALAQASTMAHMQLEVEKQLKKKSPIADMVGIPSLGDGRRKKFNRKLLQEMNLAQLQILVNDVHTQIENIGKYDLCVFYCHDSLCFVSVGQLK